MTGFVPSNFQLFRLLGSCVDGALGEKKRDYMHILVTTLLTNMIGFESTVHCRSAVQFSRDYLCTAHHALICVSDVIEVIEVWQLY